MRTHGMTDTSTYKSWQAMKGRCSGRLSKAEYYVAKGIAVCERWLSFDNFLSDMGVRPDGCTLDRIDSDKGYGPDNCRWATKTEQMRNKGDNVWLELLGERRCITEWAQITGLDRRTIRKRMKLGWPAVDVLNPGKNFRYVRHGLTKESCLPSNVRSGIKKEGEARRAKPELKQAA